MNILDRLTAAQPAPAAWVVGVTAFASLVIVLNPALWRLASKVITIAHEGGHALVSVLSGRRLDGIRLHADSSGVTYSRGKRTGPGLVLTAAAGYVTPSLLGAGAAWLLAARHLTAMLWLAVVLLAATLLAIRNLFGALAVLVTVGGVVLVSWFAPAAVQAGFGYLSAWFLLFGGIRPVLELYRPYRPGGRPPWNPPRSRYGARRSTARPEGPEGPRGPRGYGARRSAARPGGPGGPRGPRGYGRRPPRAGRSDADQLARLTGVPSGVWVGLFTLVALAALALGARLLIPG